MEERVIIKSVSYNAGKIALAIASMGVAAGGLALYITSQRPFYLGRDLYCLLTRGVPYSLLYTMPFIILDVIFYITASHVCLTVSDKRIYGRGIFGRRKPCRNFIKTRVIIRLNMLY